MKFIISAAVAGLALAVSAAGPVRAADFVILESNVAGIAPGSVVAENEQIRLDQGARLVMIAADGATRAVAGPYSGPIGRAAANAPGALQRLTESQPDTDHVVGAIRAPDWEKR
jgi:hypothetical protein